jgi:hypothetical protein
MQCVVETESFVKAAKEYGVSDEERHRIVKFVADNPDAGDVIPGTGGARKIRFPFRNKGKSGGVRVITFFAGEDIPVFLLEMFAKGDRINLSQAERNEFRQTLGEMANSYRAANKMKIAEIVERTG